jgi:hypothetical protein
MASAYQSELELESELEGLGEFEHHESEHHEGEHHEGGHHEFEHHEFEHHEHHEGSPEFEYELAHEFEADQFFGKIFRGIGRFVRRAAPFLKTIARVAAPIVGTAIGGPFGAVLGRVASQALREEEMELEMELEQHEHHEHHEHAHEFESPEHAHEFEHHEHHETAHEFEHHEHSHEFEFEHHESAHEVAHEIAHHEVSHHEALAEAMAEAASHEHHEAQAEAMMGAAVMTVLSPRDRRALRRLLPHLVRGAAVLTRILRRRRATRPAVRAVPTIVRRTIVTLKRQAASGQPITRRAAGRAAAIQVRRVLGNPAACAAAIRQNVRLSRRLRSNGAAR